MRNTKPTNTPLAREIMSGQVHILLPDTMVPVAIHQILTRRFSEMPIVNEAGEYCGMFSEKSCMRVLASLTELIDASKSAPPKAGNIMVLRQDLLTLAPENDVFDAMSELLNKGFSGAPVIDSQGRFLGVFSEKTCLGFVIEAAYSGLPSAKVGEFIDPDSNRLIDLDTDLHTIAKVFIETSYGRLPVMRDQQIVGQVSRRDVLNHREVLSSIFKFHFDESEGDSGLPMASADLGTYEKLSDHSVLALADVDSYTVDPEMNLFSIAQLFFESPHRRFPVLEGKRLIGQISRCDVLRHAITLLK
jgi:CBS domain-containing protein